MVLKTDNNQLSGLKKHAEQQRREIISKVNDAIDGLVRDGVAITFGAVATAAGVARGTLYNYPQVKERIQSLKTETRAEASADGTPVRKTKVQLLEERVASLTSRVTQLEEDKKKLIVQLVNYEELKEENERLRKLLRGGYHEK